MNNDGYLIDWRNPIANHPLNRGLVSWWLAGPAQRRSTVLRDLCGRNHGTLTNMDPLTDWVSGGGRPGGFGSLDFDATNDHVNCGTTLPFLSTLTVSAWLKYSSINDTHGYPIEHVADASNCWMIHVVAGGATANLAFKIKVGGVETKNAIAGAATLNTWEHWTCTAVSGGSLAIYKNGVAQSLGVDGNGSFTSTARLDLGGGSHSTNTQYGGQLDDARIYNRALSAGEVWQLYADSRRCCLNTLNRLRRGSASRRYVFEDGGAPATGDPMLLFT